MKRTALRRSGAILHKLALVVTAVAAVTACTGRSEQSTAYSPAYSPAGQRTVVVNEVSIRYFDINPEAAGATVLYLHGYSGTGYEMQFLKSELGPDMRIIAPDLPGLGFSGKPSVDYNLSYFLNFVRGFVDELALETFVLAGHSMGGKIASVYAALDGPDHLEGLILLAPYGLEGEAGEIVGFLSNTGSLVDVSFNLHSETLIDIAVRLNVFHDDERIPEDLVRYISAATFSSDEGIRALSNITRNAIARDPIDWLLPEISVPTLIVWGMNDRILSYRHAETFHGLISESRLVSVSECGHMPHVERPEITAAAWMTFLETLGHYPSRSAEPANGG